MDPSEAKVVRDAYDYWINDCIGVETDFRLPFLLIESIDKMTAQPQEDIIKALMSENVEQAWNDIISEHRKNGYDQIVEEINTAAKGAGIN